MARSRVIRRPTVTLPELLRADNAGTALLLAGTVLALAWANSPWQDGYGSFVRADLPVVHNIHGLVNDGLMAVFFFAIGLEIKRELVLGDLRSVRTAALPALAAVGGMVVPALLFLALNAGGPGRDGWGVPMATDIAFAVAVLALAGDRLAPSLKLFLLTLAVVDDIGAIVVIAVFYSDGVSVPALAAAGAVVAVVIGCRVLGLAAWPIYAVLGLLTWYCVFRSGVHATIAGVGLGLLVRADATEPIEHRLRPVIDALVLPAFALVNAGVVLRHDAFSADGATTVAVGAAVGLVVGKVAGISLSAWLAVRLRLGRLPEGGSWSQLVGVSAIAGIGFTVSLFVADLAFEDPGLIDAAKLGVLGASIVAAAIGVVVCRRASAS